MDSSPPSGPTLARLTHPASGVDGVELLSAIAQGLATTASPEGPAASERTWERVLATDAWEAWLIRWPAGTSVGPHDHGGSSGAFCVVRGTLVEIVATSTGSSVTLHRQGATRSFGPDIVHDVANIGDEPAVSIHVYAPPLARMARYEWAPAATGAA